MCNICAVGQRKKYSFLTKCLNLDCYWWRWLSIYDEFEELKQTRKVIHCGRRCFINSFSAFPQQFFPILVDYRKGVKERERIIQCLFTWPWLFFFVFITTAIFISLFLSPRFFPEIFFHTLLLIDFLNIHQMRKKNIIFTWN